MRSGACCIRLDQNEGRKRNTSGTWDALIPTMSEIDFRTVTSARLLNSRMTFVACVAELPIYTQLIHSRLLPLN